MYNCLQCTFNHFESTNGRPYPTRSPFCNTITTPQSVTRLLTNGTTYASGFIQPNLQGCQLILSNDGGNPLSPAGQIIPSASTPGTYTVTYTFTNGVCSNTADHRSHNNCTTGNNNPACCSCTCLFTGWDRVQSVLLQPGLT